MRGNETDYLFRPAVVLDQDMKASDVVEALAQLTFNANDFRTIAIDASVRDFLVTALRRKWRPCRVAARLRVLGSRVADAELEKLVRQALQGLRPGVTDGRSRFPPPATLRLIFHSTCVMQPAVDGCPLVATNSMEIKKVRSFLLQVREKDHTAHFGGIVGVILSPLVVFPE
jgi:hypothetical protein